MKHIKQLKISLIGIGHLGKIHCKLLTENQHIKNNSAQFVGVYDVNTLSAIQIAQQYNINYFNNIDDAISAADAIFIVAPTSFHYEIAKKCLEYGKHCFIEKPVAASIEEAKLLIHTSKQNPNLIIQVGHIERFNPAITAALQYNISPIFIEAHRLSQFRARATDVSVIHDLMIHDIDLILWLVNSPIKNIDANGVAVITNTIDIANARLNFENGTVANITASRISAKPMRKIRMFQNKCYISIDLAKSELDIFRMEDDNGENHPNAIPAAMLGEIDGLYDNSCIILEKPEIIPANAMANEQDAFIESILNETPPLINIVQATKALEVAEEIGKIINNNLIN
jgi:predicted dehydrogenase